MSYGKTKIHCLLAVKEQRKRSMRTANQLTDEAREASRMANLWLEHPYVAHAAHELAASAHESEGNHSMASEHRRAAEFWAKRESDQNSLRHTLPRN